MPRTLVVTRSVDRSPVPSRETERVSPHDDEGATGESGRCAGPPVEDSADGATVGIGAGATGFSGVVSLAASARGIAEIVAVKGTVSDSELSALEAYLKSKYAL